MTPLLQIWVQFMACAALIGWAGIHLGRYGDAIAAHTGLSRNWVGLILLSTVTSLPELVTGLSAVTLAAAPDMAVGDVLGSCVFNLLILALVDLLYRRQPLYQVAGGSHILTAGFGVILLAVAALAMLLSSLGIMPSIGHVSVASLLIPALYLLALRMIFLSEQRSASLADTDPPRISIQHAMTGYALASAVIVGAGIWLPLIGVTLAQAMGWSHSFVGTFFVAFATSVPELATTWGALRIGAVDLALGNLLGSNLFDLVILAIDDFAYLRGPLFADVSLLHAGSALTACLMSAVVIVALVYRPVSRVWHTASWAGIALLVLYLVNAIFQYRH